MYQHKLHKTDCLSMYCTKSCKRVRLVCCSYYEQWKVFQEVAQCQNQFEFLPQLSSGISVACVHKTIANG